MNKLCTFPDTCGEGKVVIKKLYIAVMECIISFLQTSSAKVINILVITIRSVLFAMSCFY